MLAALAGWVLMRLERKKEPDVVVTGGTAVDPLAFDRLTRAIERNVDAARALEDVIRDDIRERKIKSLP